MSKSIRIPFLADLLLIDQYAALRALDREPRIDRDLSPRGPLLNRYILRRAARLAHDGKPWPAFLPRDAAGRVEAVQALAARLDRIGVETLAADPDIGSIGAWVAGNPGTREQAGVRLQRLIGKLFVDGYEADAQSWDAAETIRRWTSGRPLSGLWLSLTGRLRAARDLLVARAQGDLICAHGTGIAIHNILEAVERLRGLLADPGTSGRVREETVAAQCLRSPDSLLRSVTDDLQVKERRAPLRPSSLVVVQLDRASNGTADVPAMFHADSWAACPAHGYVKVLMRAVLRAAQPDRQASTTGAASA
jgi:hypothetical protein